MFDKTKEKGYLINIGMFILICMATVLFITASVWGKDLGASSILIRYITKGTASLLFVVTGLVNLIYAVKNKQVGVFKFMILMVIGLLFAMLGDVFLIEFFELGAGLFAVGHVLFLVSFFMLSKFKWRDLICSIAIIVPAILLIVLYDGFQFFGMLPLVVAYAVIISLMLGKAVSNAFSKENRALFIIILVGAVMFFLSDLMLLFNVFASAPYLLDVLCIALYYPAEWVLAFSIFYGAFNSENSSKTIKN